MWEYSSKHAARSLLACDRCDSSVQTLVRDSRGRVVSGYGELQRHREACRPRRGAEVHFAGRAAIRIT